MRMVIKIILIISILIFSNVFAGDETTKAGTSAAQFLKIGIGARAQALGGAFVALAGDASSLYWNPAGIADIREISWIGTHTNWFADITHQFTGLIVPVNQSSVLGFSATLLSMDEEEITTIDQPRGTGLKWDAQDISVGVSYAKQLTDRFAFGITSKYIYQKIYNETASTFALDIGSTLKTGFKGLVVGMSFTNFGGDLKLAGRDLIRAYDPNPANTRNDDVDVRLHTQPWPLPVNFRVGVALDVVGHGSDNFIEAENHRVLLAVDANHPNDAAENLRVGMEYQIYRMFSLRAGYQANEDLIEFTFGGGLNMNFQRTNFRFDYALASYGELDYVNYLTFGFSF